MHLMGHSESVIVDNGINKSDKCLQEYFLAKGSCQSLRSAKIVGQDLMHVDKYKLHQYFVDFR